MKSNCCGADVTVSTSDEGTSYYVCLECNRACDFAAPQETLELCKSCWCMVHSIEGKCGKCKEPMQ